MPRSAPSRVAILVLTALLAGPAGADAGTLVLNLPFIQKYKNRATIDVEFTIDHAHKKPNAIADDGDDGDLHMAGRALKVGLPVVAEIVNAAMSPQAGALQVAKQNEGQDAVKLAGAWRLWFEHPPKGEQRQFDPVPKPKNTNPDHMFEIHPVTLIGNQAIEKSFVPIPKYRAYDAEKAFGSYDKMQVVVQRNGDAVKLIAKKAGYNYAEFRIELAGKPKKVADGYLVLANVSDVEGNFHAKQPRRMVFVEGTKPAEIIKMKKKGDDLRVLGIPRINLEAIATIASHVGNTGETAELPYEMIIVAVIEEL